MASLAKQLRQARGKQQKRPRGVVKPRARDLRPPLMEKKMVSPPVSRQTEKDTEILEFLSRFTGSEPREQKALIDQLPRLPREKGERWDQALKKASRTAQFFYHFQRLPPLESTRARTPHERLLNVLGRQREFAEETSRLPPETDFLTLLQDWITDDFVFTHRSKRKKAVKKTEKKREDDEEEEDPGEEEEKEEVSEEKDDEKEEEDEEKEDEEKGEEKNEEGERPEIPFAVSGDQATLLTLLQGLPEETLFQLAKDLEVPLTTVVEIKEGEIVPTPTDLRKWLKEKGQPQPVLGEEPTEFQKRVKDYQHRLRQLSDEQLLEEFKNRGGKIEVKQEEIHRSLSAQEVIGEFLNRPNVKELIKTVRHREREAVVRERFRQQKKTRYNSLARVLKSYPPERIFRLAEALQLPAQFRQLQKGAYPIELIPALVPRLLANLEQIADEQLRELAKEIGLPVTRGETQREVLERKGNEVSNMSPIEISEAYHQLGLKETEQIPVPIPELIAKIRSSQHEPETPRTLQVAGATHYPDQPDPQPTLQDRTTPEEDRLIQFLYQKPWRSGHWKTVLIPLDPEARRFCLPTKVVGEWHLPSRQFWITYIRAVHRGYSGDELQVTLREGEKPLRFRVGLAERVGNKWEVIPQDATLFAEEERHYQVWIQGKEWTLGDRIRHYLKTIIVPSSVCESPLCLRKGHETDQCRDCERQWRLHYEIRSYGRRLIANVLGDIHARYHHGGSREIPTDDPYVIRLEESLYQTIVAKYDTEATVSNYLYGALETLLLLRGSVAESFARKLASRFYAPGVVFKLPLYERFPEFYLSSHFTGLEVLKQFEEIYDFYVRLAVDQIAEVIVRSRDHSARTTHYQTGTRRTEGEFRPFSFQQVEEFLTDLYRVVSPVSELCAQISLPDGVTLVSSVADPRRRLLSFEGELTSFIYQPQRGVIGKEETVKEQTREGEKEKVVVLPLAKEDHQLLIDRGITIAHPRPQPPKIPLMTYRSPLTGRKLLKFPSKEELARFFPGQEVKYPGERTQWIYDPFSGVLGRESRKAERAQEVLPLTEKDRRLLRKWGVTIAHEEETEPEPEIDPRDLLIYRDPESGELHCFRLKELFRLMQTKRPMNPKTKQPFSENFVTMFRTRFLPEKEEILRVLDSDLDEELGQVSREQQHRLRIIENLQTQAQQRTEVIDSFLSLIQERDPLKGISEEISRLELKTSRRSPDQAEVSYEEIEKEGGLCAWCHTHSSKVVRTIEGNKVIKLCGALCLSRYQIRRQKGRRARSKKTESAVASARQICEGKTHQQFCFEQEMKWVEPTGSGVSREEAFDQFFQATRSRSIKEESDREKQKKQSEGEKSDEEEDEESEEETSEEENEESDKE